MKRTIDEIYNLIVEKRKNAINDKNSYNHLPRKDLDQRDIQCILYGEIEAYTDILCLIESSQILKEDNEE